MLKWIWSSPLDDNKEIELKKYLDGSLRTWQSLFTVLGKHIRKIYEYAILYNYELVITG